MIIGLRWKRVRGCVRGLEVAAIDWKGGTDDRWVLGGTLTGLTRVGKATNN